MKIRTAVIPCAGQAKRMEPYSLILPKPLLPVGDKPIIQYHLDKCKIMGINHIILIIGTHPTNEYYFEILKLYLQSHPIEDLEIEYIIQKEAKGIGHALSLVENRVSIPFSMFLGDEIYGNSNNKGFISSFDNNINAVIGLIKCEDKAKVRRNYTVKFFKNCDLISNLYEKPRDDVISDILGVGSYIFDKKIFESIEDTPPSKRNEIEITDSIQMLINKGGKVKGFFLGGDYINITYPDDLKIAFEIIQNSRNRNNNSIL